MLAESVYDCATLISNEILVFFYFDRNTQHLIRYITIEMECSFFVSTTINTVCHAILELYSLSNTLRAYECLCVCMYRKWYTFWSIK